MRLINTTTLEYEEFEPAVAPPYAILSHTWEGTELSFQDVQNSRRAGKEPEYAKLVEGCRAAKSHNYTYFWIDSCCIDKTNSVELSETINSMFRWYQQAGICLAYLTDVPPGSEVLDMKSRFAKSRWFTRGWTLQELLAPPEVEFLASDWTRITSRTESSPILAEITGIPTNFLSGDELEYASVAMRMSWASRRTTTKAEDIAYCLMGIFDIQMPLLYGEGEVGAFRRLQQEIIKDSDDQSIFAWRAENAQPTQPQKTERRAFSLLARSPADFKHSHDVVEADSPVFERLPNYLAGIRTPTVFDNKGLHLSLPMISIAPKADKVFLAVLACSKHGQEECERLAIQLEDVSTNGGRYIRIKRHELLTVSKAKILESAEYLNISVTRGKNENSAQPTQNDAGQVVAVKSQKTSRQSYAATLATENVSYSKEHEEFNLEALRNNHPELATYDVSHLKAKSFDLGPRCLIWICLRIVMVGPARPTKRTALRLIYIIMHAVAQRIRERVTERIAECSAEPNAVRFVGRAG